MHLKFAFVQRYLLVRKLILTFIAKLAFSRTKVLINFKGELISRKERLLQVIIFRISIEAAAVAFASNPSGESWGNNSIPPILETGNRTSFIFHVKQFRMVFPCREEIYG